LSEVGPGLPSFVFIILPCFLLTAKYGGVGGKKKGRKTGTTAGKGRGRAEDEDQVDTIGYDEVVQVFASILR